MRVPTKTNSDIGLFKTDEWHIGTRGTHSSVLKLSIGQYKLNLLNSEATAVTRFYRQPKEQFHQAPYFAI
jgi:hypothetical protein